MAFACRHLFNSQSNHLIEYAALQDRKTQVMTPSGFLINDLIAAECAMLIDN